MNAWLFPQVSFLQSEHGSMKTCPYPSTPNGGQIGPPGQDGATRRFTTNNWILLKRHRDQKQHTDKSPTVTESAAVTMS